MRIGTMLSMPGDKVATSGLVERAAAAEAAGFASAWLPQVGTVDALMALALAGRDTSGIELGTAVVPTYPRHPTHSPHPRVPHHRERAARRGGRQTPRGALQRQGPDHRWVGHQAARACRGARTGDVAALRSTGGRHDHVEMYGQIPSYRATLDRGGAALPADVAVLGDAAAIEAGIAAFADGCRHY